MRTIIVTFLLLALTACNTENPSVTETVPPTAQKVTLAVSNMTCFTCGPTVRKSLLMVPGVYKASVDTEANMATVFYDASQCDTKKLTTATGNAGYPSKLLM